MYMVFMKLEYAMRLIYEKNAFHTMKLSKNPLFSENLRRGVSIVVEFLYKLFIVKVQMWVRFLVGE